MDLRGKEKDNSLVGLSIKYDYLVVDTCALISPIGKGNFHKNNLDEKISAYKKKKKFCETFL